MTIRVAPAASGVNTLPLRKATPTANIRKNAPMNSTAYFRTATPTWGAGAAYTGASCLVVTPAISVYSLICYSVGVVPGPVRCWPRSVLIKRLTSGLVNWRHVVLIVFAPGVRIADHAARLRVG